MTVPNSTEGAAAPLPFPSNATMSSPQPPRRTKSTNGEHKEPTPKENGQQEQTNPSASLPLHCKWTLFYDNPRLLPSGGDWKECLKNCGTFHDVESFWRLYNNMKPCAALTVNSNYSVFRNGIEPSWEDPANADGGKFVLTINKKESKSGRCDEWWMFTVLAVIGETMDASGNQVNGAVVSIRKNQDRIALWIKSSNRRICIDIGERWKKALNLDDKLTLRYQTHRDAAASGRSFRNEVHFEV